MFLIDKKISVDKPLTFKKSKYDNVLLQFTTARLIKNYENVLLQLTIAWLLQFSQLFQFTTVAITIYDRYYNSRQNTPVHVINSKLANLQDKTFITALCV